MSTQILATSEILRNYIAAFMKAVIHKEREGGKEGGRERERGEREREREERERESIMKVVLHATLIDPSHPSITDPFSSCHQPHF